MPYIIYADLECLIKKINGCENNPENSSTTRIGCHITCEYSMSTIWGLDHVESKHILYRGKDCKKRYCDSLKEHAKNIIGLQKEKMLLLTNKELKSHEYAKKYYICGKRIQKNTKDSEKLHIIVIIQGNTEAQRIVFVI